MARATASGLGTLSHNFYRGYRPDSVLVVRLPNRPDDLDMFPGAHVARFDFREMEPEPTERFLAEVDVVFSAETLYCWRFAGAMRAAGVPTVIQGMPEFYRQPGAKGEFPPPDRWCWPTSWLLDEVPAGPVLPVPMLDVPPHRPPDGERLTFVHVAGRRAVGDRNGTELFCKALRPVRHPCKVRITTQDGALPLPDLIPRHVEVESVMSNVEDRWDLYRDADVLVLPRRYGGLSLPVLEAIGMGLAVVMTDCAPNREWPIIPIPAGVSKPGRPRSG